jgi:hypothetical protein
LAGGGKLPLDLSSRATKIGHSSDGSWG